VLLKIVYVLTCRVPGLAALVFRANPGKAAQAVLPGAVQTQDDHVKVAEKTLLLGIPPGR
jgi:hypothetical protein